MTVDNQGRLRAALKWLEAGLRHAKRNAANVVLGMLLVANIVVVARQCDSIKVDLEVSVGQLLTLLVTIVLAWVVNLALKKQQSREGFYVDAMSEYARDVLEHATKLQNEMMASSHTPIPGPAAVQWLTAEQGLRNLMTEMKREAEAWRASKSTRDSCEAAKNAWVEYKQMVTAEAFPPSEGSFFTLNDAERADAEEKFLAFRSHLAAFTRSLVD